MATKLANVMGGSACSDIVPGRSNVDINEVRRHEQEQLEQRIEEETGEVEKRKCTPIEYLKLFGEVPKLDQIQMLKPENLTKDDAMEFIEAGCTRKHLSDMYGMSVGKLYSLLTEWGLHIPKSKKTPVDKSMDASADTVEQDSKRMVTALLETGTSVSRYRQLAESMLDDELLEALEKDDRFEGLTVLRAEAIKRGLIKGKLEPDIIWLVPAATRNPRITVTKYNVVRINPAAVETAPSQYHQGCKARIGVDKKQDILVIQPVEEDGHFFKNEQRALRVTSKQVGEYIQAIGISLPATFEAFWDEELQAWVGQLVRE